MPEIYSIEISPTVMADLRDKHALDVSTVEKTIAALEKVLNQQKGNRGSVKFGHVVRRATIQAAVKHLKAQRATLAKIASIAAASSE